MKILLCNPRNLQGTKHSRKGMYAPLGLLSIATALQRQHPKQISVQLVDEDVEELSLEYMSTFDLVGFYTTTFNYQQALRYSYFAKRYGCTTILGGPHATVLPRNILNKRSCVDYILRYESEQPFSELVSELLKPTIDVDSLYKIQNIAFRRSDGSIFVNNQRHVADLSKLPIASRDYIDFDKYIDNYHKVYPEMSHVRPGSVYSSKGCSWRDKSGGCIFCARLEEGVRFRPISQIWEEISLLREEYGINLIWDIADDNLNNKEWFINFVKSRPKHLEEMEFFIYSRVNPIKEWVIPYFKELNVQEVFLGVESGDNRLLRSSFKGQTREVAFKALQLLNEHNIKFFPSFVLGLPGENLESLENTYSMCKDIVSMGGLDRLAATILQPIPGSPAYDRLLNETPLGNDLQHTDVVDLDFITRYFIDAFCETDYHTIFKYQQSINELMKGLQVFGGSTDD